MRKRSSILMAVLCLMALTMCTDELVHSGKWMYETEETSFDLTLKQQDTIVTGSHFSVMLNGNRIDGALDDEETIRGVVKNGKAIVSIKSMYGLGTGKAKLSFVGKDSLYFEFIERPEGESWIPNKVILTRYK